MRGGRREAGERLDGGWRVARRTLEGGWKDIGGRLEGGQGDAGGWHICGLSPSTWRRPRFDTEARAGLTGSDMSNPRGRANIEIIAQLVFGLLPRGLGSGGAHGERVAPAIQNFNTSWIH